MSKINTKRLVPLITAAAAGIFLFFGVTKYGFWGGTKGPLSGFVPSIIAAIMILVSLLAFAQSFKEEPATYPKENTLVMLGGAGIIAATFIIGLIPSVAIYVVVWLKGLEKCTWKQTLIVLAVIMAIVLGVFVAWLKVPFPQGIIFEALLG